MKLLHFLYSAISWTLITMLPELAADDFLIDFIMSSKHDYFRCIICPHFERWNYSQNCAYYRPD